MPKDRLVAKFGNGWRRDLVQKMYSRCPKVGLHGLRVAGWSRLRGIKTNGLDADLKVRTTRTALFQQLANAVLLQITFARGLSVATRAALCQALQSTLHLSFYFGGGAAECGF